MSATRPSVLTEAQIVAESRGPEPLPAGLPRYITGSGADGHAYRYRVIGTYPDGTLRTSQWDAEHLDRCACSDPESWY